MTIFFPDTSTLISLFDETDPLHKKVNEIVRKYRIKDIFVPMTVQTEWQSRTMREFRKLVITTVRLLDEKRVNGKLELTMGEFNVIVETAATQIRDTARIEHRKLDRAKKDLEKEISQSFRNSSGTSLTKLKTQRIKENILRLTYAFYERGTSVIGFFIQHGHSHPDISEDVEKSVKLFIAEHLIDLETQDAMILGDLIRYSVSDSEIYEFVVGDKDFFKKGQKYIELYESAKDKIVFKFLNGYIQDATGL